MATTEKLKRGDLREALLQYAMQESLAGRIETMSLRKAARDLGVSSGAVYRHFEDKQALFMEFVHRGFERMEQQFFAIRPEGDAAKTVAQAVERSSQITITYVQFAHKNPALWHMMFGRIGVLCREERLQDPDFLHYTIMDVVTENCRDLYRLGALSKEPDIQDIRYLWSATHGAAELAQSGSRLDSDQMDMICEETSKRNLKVLGFQSVFSSSTSQN